MNDFRCDICGKFISYQDLDDNKINSYWGGNGYYEDSYYAQIMEYSSFSHKTCENKQ